MTHSTPTAADLAALRWACLVDPFADLPRLVLADALEETRREKETKWAHVIRENAQSGHAVSIRLPGYDFSPWDMGLIDGVEGNLGVILGNLDVFRLHPITQVMATDKRALHCEGLKEWTWWFEEEEESEPEASLPKIIWNRLRPTKNKNRRGYTRGDANYYTKSEALEDLSRAIVSLGREHAGLPQLRWPT